MKRHFFAAKGRSEADAKPPFMVVKLGSYGQWLSYSEKMQNEFRARRICETEFAGTGDPFSVDGYCWICKSPRSFEVDYLYSEVVDGRRVPNWRERLVCESCGLSNRLRAAIHVFESLFTVNPGSTIYITEQLTPVYRYLKRQYRYSIGSEYLGTAVPRGTTRQDGLRNEDLTVLSFESNGMDFILSFDVFEHIPDYMSAFAECYRVLKPAGSMLFSVPFGLNSENNLTRARMNYDGSVEHLLPPEYHSNPVDPSGGSLCFRHFGWNMLDQLKSVGFTTTYAAIVWSLQYAYLRQVQVFFVAQK